MSILPASIGYKVMALVFLENIIQPTGETLKPIINSILIMTEKSRGSMQDKLIIKKLTIIFRS